MCQWSPTQNQLATGSGDGVCRLWGLGEMTEDKWKLKSDVSIESQFVSVSTAILPHSSTQGEKYKDVTSITWRYMVSNTKMWNTKMWYDILICGILFSCFPTVVCSPDGQYIATGCYDGLIRVWESSGKLHMLLREHTGPVFSLKWSRTQLPQEDDEGVSMVKYFRRREYLYMKNLRIQ
jgi:WD40 repeat protein